MNEFFRLEERGTSLRTELRGATVTFLTMAYILGVNPAILAQAGVPRESAVACTAAAAGLCCILMGLVANFPLALASGMGLNSVVALSIAPQVGSWQAAMGLVVWNGIIVAILVLCGLREAIMQAIPADIRRAIGGGIGLFIALIGMVGAGFVQQGDPPAPPVTPGSFTRPETLLAVFGLLVTVVLMVRRVTGALLIGIVLTTAAAWLSDRCFATALVPDTGARLERPTFETMFQADLVSVLKWQFAPLLLSLLVVDFFDTLGTVSTIADQAELRDDAGHIPRLRSILLVDSAAASIGGLFGASSVTSYIESAAGVAEGARTGLHTVFVGVMFLACIALAPLVSLVPPAATTPALIVVGFLMAAQVRNIDWTRSETSFPAFLTMIGMPFTYSIAHGIGCGCVSFAAIKLLTLRPRELHPLMLLTALVFAAYFAWSG